MYINLLICLIIFAPHNRIVIFDVQVSLSREDQAIYEGWEYTCVDDFQQEVVDFLTYRDSHSVGFDTNGGGCCNVS